MGKTGRYGGKIELTPFRHGIPAILIFPTHPFFTSPQVVRSFLILSNTAPANSRLISNLLPAHSNIRFRVLSFFVFRSTACIRSLIGPSNRLNADQSWTGQFVPDLN